MKIAFISPYKELSSLVEQISLEMEITVDVFSGTFQEGANIAKDLEKRGYDIIISRGATYSSIMKEVKIPVVNCSTSSFDILYALYEAIKISSKIGLILPEYSPFLNDLIADIFNINLLYRTSY